MRLTFSLSALILLLASSLDATAILVFRTPERIILASDSAQTIRRDASGNVNDVELICKVRPAGRWWVTTSGFSTHGSFDAFASVTGALTGVETLGAAKVALVKLYPTIREALENAHRTNPNGFKNLYPSPRPVLDIVLAGANAHDETLRVALLTIRLQQIGPLRFSVSWLECPGAFCNGADVPGALDPSALFYGAGVEGPVVRLMTPPLHEWVLRADAAAAARIIQAAIAATPLKVSAPIDIVEITTRGARWVNRDKASTCSPNTNNP